MPVFWHKWSPFQSLADLTKVASQLPQSIAGLYYNHRSDGFGAVTDDPLIPHRPRLLHAVNESIAAHPEMQPMMQTLQDDSALCVHLRSGDYGLVHDSFLRTLAHLSKQFAKIVVLSGVHCNGDEPFIAQNKARLNDGLDRIRTLVPHAVFDFNHPDVHVCYMAKARNLLVHMGGFSILGTLVFSGKNLYVTTWFQPLVKNKNDHLWYDLNIPHQVIDAPSRANDYEMPIVRGGRSAMPMIRSAMPMIRSAMSMMRGGRSAMPMMRSNLIFRGIK